MKHPKQTVEPSRREQPGHQVPKLYRKLLPVADRRGSIAEHEAPTSKLDHWQDAGGVYNMIEDSTSRNVPIECAAPNASTTAAPMPRRVGSPYQRGPQPNVESVLASHGIFATAQANVPAGVGFKSGVIYYPNDANQECGGIAIMPGYTALFADEEAWMGPWLASFGFVVIGVETNSTTDDDVARGTQLLAALDYLTQESSVRDRVDANRLSVIGHSMGGGGAISAAERRPTLKAAVALAPFSPSQDLSTLQVPTMIIAGQSDTLITPTYVDRLYGGMPASTQSTFVELAGADHLFPTKPNVNVMRLAIPWLKIFVDSDSRYNQLLCPSLADSSGVSQYRSKCPYIPPSA